MKERFAPQDLGRFVDRLRDEGDTEQIGEFLAAVDEIAKERIEGAAADIVEDATSPRKD